MNKVEQDIQEREKALEENLDEQESLKQQLKSEKGTLIDAKHIIWDHLSIELKKLRYYFGRSWRWKRMSYYLSS